MAFPQSLQFSWRGQGPSVPCCEVSCCQLTLQGLLQRPWVVEMVVWGCERCQACYHWVGLCAAYIPQRLAVVGVSATIASGSSKLLLRRQCKGFWAVGQGRDMSVFTDMLG